mmetsp:Transcript_105438/g.303209  ORF Transcript_105438/g.303209 Transcript_105438/m.303209 type:complete len:232 (+) Transcript_105438:422-1117(+)
MPVSDHPFKLRSPFLTAHSKGPLWSTVQRPSAMVKMWPSPFLQVPTKGSTCSGDSSRRHSTLLPLVITHLTTESVADVTFIPSIIVAPFSVLITLTPLDTKVHTPSQTVHTRPLVSRHMPSGTLGASSDKSVPEISESFRIHSIVAPGFVHLTLTPLVLSAVQPCRTTDPCSNRSCSGAPPLRRQTPPRTTALEPSLLRQLPSRSCTLGLALRRRVGLRSPAKKMRSTRAS